jgi:hypothetical protein
MIFRLSKVFKNIAVFPLWLAGLVIIAHLVIPHDHHPDCSVFNKGNECHADNSGHPVKSPGFPLHCHALNDLTFERTTYSIIVCNNIPACDLFILSFIESNALSFSSPCVRIKDFQKLFTETDLYRFPSFRAPPSLV